MSRPAISLMVASAAALSMAARCGGESDEGNPCDEVGATRCGGSGVYECDGENEVFYSCETVCEDQDQSWLGECGFSEEQGHDVCWCDLGDGEGYAEITLTVTDRCDDELDLEYKFYDVTNSLVWPNGEEHYTSSGLGVASAHMLKCLTGALVCYGANAGDRYWGVSIDGDEECGSCCVTCASGVQQGFELGCD